MAAEGPGSSDFKRRRVGEPTAGPPPPDFSYQRPPRPLQPNDRTARSSSSSTAEPPTTPAHENGDAERKPSVCAPNPGCSNCTQNLHAHANLVNRYERLKRYYEALQDQDRGHRHHISVLKEKLEENKKGIDEMLGNDASRLASVNVKGPPSGSSTWTAPIHTEPVDHREQAELKNKCAGLLHALKELEKHVDQQEGRIKFLENKIKHDDGIIRDLNTQIRALMREADERRQRDAEMQKKMAEMEATDKGHAEKVAEITQKHSLEMEKIKGDLESASTRLKQAVEAEKKRAEELTRAKQECEALKAEQAKASGLLAQTREQVVAETIKAAEERHAKEVKQAEHKIRAHSLKKFQELTKQQKSFETQLKAALEEVERLKAEARQAKAEASEWKTKFEFQPLEFRRQIDEATEKWTKKLQLMKEVHEQDVSKLIVKLEAADKLAEERLDGFTSEWQKRNDQNTRLTAQILEQQKTITEQKAALDANRTEIQSLNSELAAANAKLVDIKPPIVMEDKEKKELRDKIAFLETYKKRLEQQEQFLYVEWNTAVTTKARLNDELKDVLDERDYVVQKYPHVAADMQQRLARRRAAKAAEAPSTSGHQQQ